jgi:signal recognition particle receptor subunit beta
MQEAREYLEMALVEERFQNTPILVLANKQDLKNCMAISEIAEKLFNCNNYKGRFTVQPCIATTGEGLYEGMHWLAESLKQQQ